MGSLVDKKSVARYHMNVMRLPKTFSIEQSLLAEVERTKGERSTSERVNDLLQLALQLEKREEFEHEAAHFYAPMRDDRTETRAYQKAALRSLTRD